MTDLEQEAAWRAEFEADGERAVLDTICHGPGIYPDPKRSFALRWLREREVERARQEKKMRSYVRYTFWAADSNPTNGHRDCCYVGDLVCSLDEAEHLSRI
jgi:hypothetical protein